MAVKDSLTSRMMYLSFCETAFRFLKSCMNCFFPVFVPSLFATMNIGVLCALGCSINTCAAVKSVANSSKDFSSSMGILNCCTYVGWLVVCSILC